MRKFKLDHDCKARFLEALADTGIVYRAAKLAGTSRSRVYELRKADPDFAKAWAEAEEIAADRLEEEARRRAVDGVLEPVVSGGRVVRDDEGNPLAIRRYSDALLTIMLRARRPEQYRDQKLIHAGDPDSPLGFIVIPPKDPS